MKFYWDKAEEANWFASQFALCNQWEMVLGWATIGEGWLSLSAQAAQAGREEEKEKEDKEKEEKEDKEKEDKEKEGSDIDLEEVDRIMDFQEITMSEIEDDWEDKFVLAEYYLVNRLLSSSFQDEGWGYWEYIDDMLN